jgi:hypothetical protein
MWDLVRGDVRSVDVHFLFSFSGVGVFRTAEDQRTGRKEAAPSPKGNGQHGSVSEWSGQRR